MSAHTEPTTHYWQRLLAPGELGTEAPPPWRYGYPARLPDGRVLMLPIRALVAGGNAVASLLLNQASFEVTDTLADLLAARLAPLAPQVVVGLPTLGLTLAAAVARRLGHARYVPLGSSRKFWYRDDLSVPVRSITSPETDKRLYLDPHLLPLAEGRRVVLVDDVISTGQTAQPPWRLLESLGAEVLAYGVAMLQGRRWEAVLGDRRGARVVGVFESPLLEACEAGWQPCR